LSWVRGGIVQRRGQHGDRRAGGIVRGDQVGQRVGVEQRNVAGRHDDDAGEVSGQRRQSAQRGVTGTKLLVLHRHLDRAAQRSGQIADGLLDELAIAAHHHHQVKWGHLGDRVQRVRQHAAPGEGVQHLRGARAHPGTGPGRQDEDRRFAMRCQENLLATGRALRQACCAATRSACHYPHGRGKGAAPPRASPVNREFPNRILCAGFGNRRSYGQ
jgi:hypothetical protein